MTWLVCTLTRASRMGRRQINMRMTPQPWQSSLRPDMKPCRLLGLATLTIRSSASAWGFNEKGVS